MKFVEGLGLMGYTELKLKGLKKVYGFIGELKKWSCN